LTKSNNITFTSFLDDLTFSSAHDFKELVPVILKIIKSGGFYLNHKKIYYKTNRPEITGLIIYEKRLWLPDGMKDKAKKNPFLGYLK